MNLSELTQFFSMITPGGVGVWMMVLMFGVYLTREWRETRKLSSSDRLARREGYAAEVANLREENRKLYIDLHDARGEYDKYRRLCQIETDQLRAMLIAVTDEMSGYKRRLDSVVLEMSDQRGATR